MKPASLKSSDFQQALGTRPVSRTPHFALHALWASATSQELSTTPQPLGQGVVDDLRVELVLDVEQGPAAPLSGACRLGLVLPKKQARRSVTRSLIRHQAREAVRRHGPRAGDVLLNAASNNKTTPLPSGSRRLTGWVLRLTRGFDRQAFPSAASVALNQAVRLELDELWAHVRPTRS